MVWIADFRTIMMVSRRIIWPKYGTPEQKNADYAAMDCWMYISYELDLPSSEHADRPLFGDVGVLTLAADICCLASGCLWTTIKW